MRLSPHTTSNSPARKYASVLDSTSQVRSSPRSVRSAVSQSSTSFYSSSSGWYPLRKVSGIDAVSFLCRLRAYRRSDSAHLLVGLELEAPPHLEWTCQLMAPVWYQVALCSIARSPVVFTGYLLDPRLKAFRVAPLWAVQLTLGCRSRYKIVFRGRPEESMKLQPHTLKIPNLAALHQRHFARNRSPYFFFKS